jgi:hypothetical protein
MVKYDAGNNTAIATFCSDFEKCERREKRPKNRKQEPSIIENKED